jgi:hypothetical protein
MLTCPCGTKAAPRLHKQTFRYSHHLRWTFYCPQCLHGGDAGHDWKSAWDGWDASVERRKRQSPMVQAIDDPVRRV